MFRPYNVKRYIKGHVLQNYYFIFHIPKICYDINLIILTFYEFTICLLISSEFFYGSCRAY